MTLELLQKQMYEAMKNKDKVRKDTISALVSAVKKVAIDKKCKDNITESLVDEVILKEKKTVQEMIDTCPPDRTELMAEYKTRLSVIEEFAPKLITNENEIRSMVNHLLEVINIQSGNKGTVMKNIMPRLKGKVDMKIANKVLTEILSKC